MSKRLSPSLLIAVASALLGCGNQNAGTSDVSSAGGSSGIGGSAAGIGGTTGSGSGGANGTGDAGATGGSNGSGGALGTGGATTGAGGASGTGGCRRQHPARAYFFGADVTDQEPARRDGASTTC